MSVLGLVVQYCADCTYCVLQTADYKVVAQPPVEHCTVKPNVISKGGLHQAVESTAEARQRVSMLLTLEYSSMALL